MSDARDKGARFLLVLACGVIVVAGLKAARDLFTPFLIALFLSMISLPLLNWLQTKRIPRPLAVAATMFAALAVLGGIAGLIGGSIRSFTADAPKYKERLEALTRGMRGWLSDRGFAVSDPVFSDLVNPGEAVDLVTGTLVGVAGVLSNLLVVLLFIVFILAEAAGFPKKIEAAFGQRESLSRFGNIRDEVQHYLGIKTLVSLTTGGVVAGSMAVIGIDYPLLWGAVAFLLNYIPALGSIIASVPPVVLAIIQYGPGRAIAVAAVFLTANITLGNFVEPYFMGRRLGLSTLVVFTSLVFWGWVWGPVGMLLSVPLTMIIKIMLENTADLRWAAVLLDAHPQPIGARRNRRPANAPGSQPAPHGAPHDVKQSGSASARPTQP